jgi:hypothetical protein
MPIAMALVTSSKNVLMVFCQSMEIMGRIDECVACHHSMVGIVLWRMVGVLRDVMPSVA